MSFASVVGVKGYRKAGGGRGRENSPTRRFPPIICSKRVNYWKGREVCEEDGQRPRQRESGKYSGGDKKFN